MEKEPWRVSGPIQDPLSLSKPTQSLDTMTVLAYRVSNS